MSPLEDYIVASLKMVINNCKYALHMKTENTSALQQIIYFILLVYFTLFVQNMTVKRTVLPNAVAASLKDRMAWLLVSWALKTAPGDSCVGCCSQSEWAVWGSEKRQRWVWCGVSQTSGCDLLKCVRRESTRIWINHLCGTSDKTLIMSALVCL